MKKIEPFEMGIEEGGTIEEKASEEKKIPDWKETKTVGKKIPRVDSYEIVSGTAKYSSDINLPGMLYAKILRSPHPHAEIIDIDTSKAEALPGVKGVLYYKNAPKIKWYPDDKSFLFDRTIRYVGDEVATVVAEDEYIAQDALKLIEVRYKPLPFVLTPEEAMKPEAPKIWPEGNLMLYDGKSHRSYSRGDVEKGFADADIVLERKYTTPVALHCTWETHSNVANWDGDYLTLWESSQGVFWTQEQVAQKLNIPVNKIRVICHYMGGGFGSKWELNKQSIIAALFAQKTGRSVKIIATRQENMVAYEHRPSSIQYVKAGVKKYGNLTALSMKYISPIGAYPWIYAGSGEELRWLYRCENVKTDQYIVYTNVGRAGAMRAPGSPEGAFALEQMMDELAEKLNMDPLELRLRNNAEVCQRSGKPLVSKGLTECMQEGAKLIGWNKKKKAGSSRGRKKIGLGMGCGNWGDGSGPPATTIVKITYDGTINLITGASDLGTGTRTVMSMIVAEELRIPLDSIQITCADTETTCYTTFSGGSKTVASVGPSVRLAAYDAKRKLLSLAAYEMKVDPGDVDIKDGIIFHKSNPENKLTIKEVASKAIDRVIVGVGKRKPNDYEYQDNIFCCHFAEVEVDTVTGEIKLLRYVAAHDSARVLNRFTYDNQIHGGIGMSIGYTFTEERIMDKAIGKVLNNNLADYKIATQLDMPEKITIYAAETYYPRNNINVKGLGEPPAIPPAGAIANAIYNALGVRFYDIPITPDKVVQALKSKGV
jgi:xanthine dehydrogenase YagR molybdenum-binding subunit